MKVDLDGIIEADEAKKSTKKSSTGMEKSYKFAGKARMLNQSLL